MPKIDVYDINGKKVKELELNEAVFGIEPNETVVHSVLVNFLANQRQGTQSTKTRSEVSGGGRKPWRQKGTGNARQGSIRSVQWVGGGIAFGPVPRSYNKKQNRKERKLALKSAWSYKAKNNNLVVVDEIKLDSPRTKDMIKLLTNLKLNDEKLLVVVKEYNENVILASRNLQNIMLLQADEVGVLDIVSARKVLIEDAALESIKEVLK